MGRMPRSLQVVSAHTAALALASVAAAPAAAAPGPAEVRDGPARFQVITPTLIRLEYAADGGFEDRPTLTVPARGHKPPPYKTSVKDGILTIRTSRVTLRYRIGGGPFDASNLRLKINGFGGTRPSFPAPSAAPSAAPPTVPPPAPDPDPRPQTAGNLGGWYRSLDNQSGPVQLHDGLMSRDGWYILDDTESALSTEGGRWYAERPDHQGVYRDGYLFAYGSDYVRGLADFRTLTGPAPLLPRKAFGNWFSRYEGYGEADFHRLVARFRANRVPLDVLIVDTDYKSPRDWDGWQWAPVYFENPSRFLNWAHSVGLDVTLNVHPSISAEDPSFASASEIAGGLIDGGERCTVFIRDAAARCSVWDWAQRSHVDSYFSLHTPFEEAGVDSWWLDYCCDESRADADGLTPDSWINALYAQRSRDRGLRWLPLSRIGSSMFNQTGAAPGVWAEHRNAIHFTGDSFSTWPMLDFQTRFTAAEGAGIGMPYVSHDIGGFNGNELPTDLYVRWLQAGAVAPILRLHSNHAPRLPWEYGGRAEKLGELFMRLRGSLVPYIYTLARQAYDTGLPLARAMYLEWPKLGDAYRYDRQYMLGDQLLVAPVARPGDPARKRVWFPPGRWVDLFTGEVHTGARAETLRVPLERMPIFARAGGIVPRADYRPYVGRGAPDPLILNVYAGDNGRFTLYEDEGVGFGYRAKRFARTPMRWSDRSSTLTIGKARGHYPGDPAKRRYSVRVTGIDRPSAVRVGGRELRGFDYDAGARLLILKTPALSTKRATAVSFTFGR
ncbi:MAG TPA: TIM-barrel domain-containing protein [Solirubrobacterales bacterium]|nr:TIM-barrel domain-containing protein [Solirubrobacterales bacterium]